MAEPFRWSNSSLSLLSSCAEAFRRRYIEGERTPPNSRMLRGRVVHEVAQAAYTRKLERGDLFSTEQAEDEAATRFNMAWPEVQLDSEDRELGEAKAKDASLDFAVDLSGYHVQRVAPAVHPIAVEERMTVTLPESDILVHGIVDLIDLQDGQDVVRDLKTAEKAPNANAAETSLQLTIYAALWKADVGHLPKRLVLDYITRTPAKRMKGYIPLTTTRDDEDLRVLGSRLNTAVELVKRGIFMPAPVDSWKCSDRWCEYYPTCPYVRRGERRPST